MADAYVRFDEAGMRQLFESTDGPLGKHLKKSAIRVERKAKTSMSPGGGGTRHVPSAPGQPPAVDTGRLRSSITHELGQDERGLVARIGTNVSYGKHLELGTSKMAARPYLRPALDVLRKP